MWELQVGRGVWWRLGRLGLLLAHLRRLLGIRVEVVPFLDPVVCRLCGLYGQPSRDVLLVPRAVKLEQLEFLLGIELRSKYARGDNLQERG